MVYGGGDGALWDQQKKALRLGADVAIATPGRLIAHLQHSDIDLSQVKYFILDEADRMLDMGFFDDIMQIVNKLPKDRQTIPIFGNNATENKTVSPKCTSRSS